MLQDQPTPEVFRVCVGVLHIAVGMCVCLCVRACMYICVYACAHMPVHVCVGVCVDVSMHACVLVYGSERAVEIPGEMEVCRCHAFRPFRQAALSTLFLQLQMASTVSDEKQLNVFVELSVICYHLQVSVGGITSGSITGSDDRTLQKSILLVWS